MVGLKHYYMGLMPDAAVSVLRGQWLTQYAAVRQFINHALKEPHEPFADI